MPPSRAPAASSPGSCRGSVRTTRWAPSPSPPGHAWWRIRPRAAPRSRPSCRPAPTPLPAVLEIRADEEQAAPVPIELAPGTSLVELPYRFRAEGEFLLRARLLLPSDQRRAPSPAGVPISVTPPARVLLVSELARPVVGAALTRRGADVDVVRPAALSPYLAGLADYHAVILDDVGRAGLGDARLERLRAYVARGGALIAT